MAAGLGCILHPGGRCPIQAGHQLQADALFHQAGSFRGAKWSQRTSGSPGRMLLPRLPSCEESPLVQRDVVQYSTSDDPWTVALAEALWEGRAPRTSGPREASGQDGSLAFRSRRDPLQSHCLPSWLMGLRGETVGLCCRQLRDSEVAIAREARVGGFSCSLHPGHVATALVDSCTSTGLPVRAWLRSPADSFRLPGGAVSLLCWMVAGQHRWASQKSSSPGSTPRGPPTCLLPRPPYSRPSDLPPSQPPRSQATLSCSLLTLKKQNCQLFSRPRRGLFQKSIRTAIQDKQAVAKPLASPKDRERSRC